MPNTISAIDEKRFLQTTALTAAMAALLHFTPPAAARTFPYPLQSEVLQPSGLRVVYVPMDSPGLFAYYTLVRVGSRNEVDAGRSGFAHFFEHMMFRGTERFTEADQKRIVTELGLDSNAFTWDDETVYYDAGPSTAIDKVIELEADRFQYLKYNEEQFKTEAKSVLGEYHKNDSDPGQRIEETLLGHAFRKHPYRHPTIGFKSDIERMPAEYQYSLTFFKQFYRPDNCTIFVIGDFNRAAVSQKIHEHYGSWSATGDQPVVPVEPRQTAEQRARIEWPSDTKPRLTVGWHGPAAATREGAVQKVLGPLLFGLSSPLQEDLVLRRHLVEGFEVSYMGEDQRPGHRDPRLFSYTAVLKKPGDLPIVAETIDKAIAELRAGAVDARRLDDVKQHLHYELLGSLETPVEVGALLSLFIAPTGDLDAVDDEFERLAAVTPGDVVAFARKYLVDKNRTVVTTVARPAAARGASR